MSRDNQDPIVEIVEALEIAGRPPDSYNLLEYIDVEAFGDVIQSLHDEYYIRFSIDEVEVTATEEGITAKPRPSKGPAEVADTEPAITGEMLSDSGIESKQTANNAIYQRAIDLTHRILPADVVKIAVPRDGSLVPLVSTNDGNVGPDYAVPIEISIPGQVLASGVSSVVGDMQQTRGASSASASTSGKDQHITRSMLCVPIGESGVLVAFASQPDRFKDEHREIAEEMGKLVEEATRETPNTDS